MDRKEGAVDNRQWAISEYYKSGWRAYQNFDGGKVLYKDGVYHHTIASGHHSEAGKWHSLRAYQDAERKKGTPIDPKDLTGKDWVYRDYYGFAFNIEVRVGHPQKLKIYVYDHENNGNFPVAKFTNFRWRAGYPKGGQNG